MSRRSNKHCAKVLCAPTSDLSNSGTPRAWVENGALFIVVGEVVVRFEFERLDVGVRFCPAPSPSPPSPPDTGRFAADWGVRAVVMLCTRSIFFLEISPSVASVASPSNRIHADRVRSMTRTVLAPLHRAPPIAPRAGGRSRRATTISGPGTRAGRPWAVKSALGASESERERIVRPPSERERTVIRALAVPATYKQLVAFNTGPSFKAVAKVKSGISLDQLIDSLESDEVVVQVAYAGVNGGCETFRCRGEHAFARNKSLTEFALGAEGVGTVVALGSDGGTDGIELNAPVMFVGGAFSEYVKVKRAACFPVPEASAAYAALRISGHVAYSALTYRVSLRPDQVVLVTAGAGATGSFAVQVAKRRGCHVVATCRNEAKAEVLRRLGVDRVIEYGKEDVHEVFERAYRHRVDVVYEGVGGKLLEDSWRLALNPDGGRLLSVGYISEYPHNRPDVVEAARHRNEGLNLPPSEDIFWKALTLEEGRKTFIGNVWPDDADVRQRALKEAVALVQGGELECLVDPKPFIGVESAPDAVEYMLRGEAIGKVVVRLRT